MQYNKEFRFNIAHGLDEECIGAGGGERCGLRGKGGGDLVGGDSPERRIFPVGPMEAKTSAGRAARREISTPARLMASRSVADVDCIATALARKVLVGMTWLPASA